MMQIEMTPEQVQATIDTIENEISDAAEYAPLCTEDLQNCEYMGFLLARAEALATLKAAKIEQEQGGQNEN
jgi:putative methionine-R-sulfoxide reductase with GAF domain